MFAPFGRLTGRCSFIHSSKLCMIDLRGRHERLGRTAVVLGGSVAGLCAAGALAPHFDEVLVLERDELPADAEHRRGVPQSKHPHFLLNSGRRAINDLFPGFEDDLIAAGGLHLVASDGHGLPRGPRLGTAQAGRPDDGLRLTDPDRAGPARQGARLANVTIREGVSVSGIDTTGGGTPQGRVTGVSFSSPAGDERIDADLVVDAMGRGSSVSDWLVAAGWPETPVMTLDAKVTYVSRWYDLPAPEDRPAVVVVAAHGDHADPGEGRAPGRARVPGQLLPDGGQPQHRLHGVVGHGHAAHGRRLRGLGRAAADADVRRGDGGVRADLGGPPDPLDRATSGGATTSCPPRRWASCSSATPSARSTRSTARA